MDCAEHRLGSGRTNPSPPSAPLRYAVALPVATGTVVDGKVVLEGVALPEGALVTVLSSDTEASVRLSPAEVADLMVALDEADQEAGTAAEEVLERPRKFGELDLTLQVIIKPRALRHIEKAAQWWSHNRPAALGAIRLNLQSALRVLAEHSGIGTKVERDRKVDVRRFYLTRIRYFIYFRVTGQSLEVITSWHERRGAEPSVRFDGETGTTG